MRKIAAILLLLSSFALAQEKDSDKTKDTKPASKSTAVFANAMKFGSQQIGVFVGGGTGVGKRSSTQFAFVGGRYGWVLTDNHGKSWYRGNFEFDIDVLPFTAYLQPGKNAFGAEFRPVVMKWNFTGGKKIVPFAEISGGMLFTNNDVPTNTNNFNFTPQGGLGLHFFRDPKHSITTQIKYQHVSNAGLANNNSGINAAIQFTLGYTWWR